MIFKEKSAGKTWKECFPLGNGHLGAMVSLNPQREEIYLSENTFFSGEPGAFSNQETAPGCFYRMRELVSNGDYSGAEEIQKSFVGRRENYGTNLPVGRMVLETTSSCETEHREYVRSLDLENGIACADYNIGSSHAHMECFATHPENAFVYKRSSQNRKEDYELSFLPHQEGNDKIVYLDRGIIFSVKAHESMHSDGMTGVRLTGTVQVWTDGTCAADAGVIRILGAGWLILQIKMVTDFGEKALDYPLLCGKLKHELMGENRAEPPYLKWKEEHCRDFGKYMRRSRLEIEDEEGLGEEISLMYQYGRYLLLSSSREDSLLPAHLQGVWNDNVACRIGWTCDMHLDINTQMNYWPAEITGLSECAMPLFRWVEEDLVRSGQITAREAYGLKGWVAELVSNAWSYTAPYWDIPISPCPTGGVWTAVHLWEHYLFTGDREFLREHVFPVISGAVDFFVDYLFWDEKEGHYLTGPSISPENSFIGRDGQVHYLENACTYEVLMVRELYMIFLECCRLLEISDGREEKVKHQLEFLPHYPVNRDGTLGEWREDKQQTDPQHRHTSHLLGLYPFCQITPEDTPELAEAASRTIRRKLEPESNWEDTGWARALLVLYSARLHDGEQALRHVRTMMRKLKAPNQMIMHPPTRGAGSFADVYELDGNTGLTAGIAEMLLQSHGEILRILPALPVAWKKGCALGLCARGGLSVDITWDNGQVEIRIWAHNNYHGWVEIGEEKKEITLKGGEEMRMCI
ncbi:glycoside hydrolase family 95 protein [Blautia schinkii]|nr:glycoside hydrolase family 95 protein [Blautia schinkii]